MNMNQSENKQTTADVEAALIGLNEDMIQAEEAGRETDLAKHLHPDFKIVRGDFSVEDRQTFLRAVPGKANAGRKPDLPTVNLFGDRAIVTCRVTTNSGYFWNTRLFVREQNEWQCTKWQVVKISDL
jgi:hypothetical protein